MAYRKKEWLMLMMALASVLMAGWFYPQLPDQLATHWNMDGQVDGYMEKGWATFMLPGMMLFFVLLFFIIPKIDPLKKNIEKFRDKYEEMVLVILAFFLLIFLQTMLWNMGMLISPALTVPVAVGLLFIYLGYVLPKAKRNWFVGIRTPWTMSSDKVWDKTHRMGGKLFIMMGIILILSIFLGSGSFYVLIGLVLVSVIYLFWYSYAQFQKEKK
ncbi:MAG: SdpI family protein [Candidatus ainarchaeum sp.]|nr:SdpI family protein [Candidatus ainarchaeum sp.]